jgi:hypothetical protein
VRKSLAKKAKKTEVEAGDNILSVPDPMYEQICFAIGHKTSATDYQIYDFQGSQIQQGSLRQARELRKAVELQTGAEQFIYRLVEIPE